MFNRYAKIILKNIRQSKIYFSISEMESLNGGANPWLVENLSDFSYLCCPECDYRTQVEGFFEHHAVNKHPSSIEFFSAEVADEVPEEESFAVNVKEEAIEDYDDSNYIEVDLKADFDEDVADGDIKTENDQKPVSKPKKRIKKPKGDKSNKRIKDEALPGDTAKQECSKCQEVIFGFYNHSLHLKDHHGKDSTLWPCAVCDKPFKEHKLMKNHIKTVHLKLKEKCDICGAEVQHMRQHLKQVHQPGGRLKSFKCEECGFATHSKLNLKAHVKYKHEKDTHDIECDQCEKKFHTRSALKQHKVLAHLEASFMCDKCGKGFKLQSGLLYHHQSKACESKEPIKCDRCDDEFKARNSFILHYRAVHKGCLMPDADQHEFMCDQCPSTFLNKPSLKMHIYQKHSGYKRPPRKKDRKCEQCDQTFFSSGAYNEHVQRVHENSTPFKCEQCNKSYGTRYMLRHHTKQVHLRAKCDECGKEMSNDFNLQRHKSAVHGTKPSGYLICPCCPFIFKLNKFAEAHLTAHIAKHHPEHSASA